ncbi:hypothetical protein QEH59_08125 [Coraliomargarita sp. SDUM461004]|uniref:Uncharacterized protein n=1 Tax=Thalassobacterium sedimentorum TaxID=3041258 RepID=A0ABU1AID4_9BACT|nr:hypothetical protein [Coraliomargarita sp. SDUM461004]MDQ8194389.1 hypothetical protein [Coraliomargarita sp. SDUM461004]
MAKKPQKLIPLTMTEIILRGDAETIRQALEARIQIDTLLEEREAAYQRIAELETQVCDIVGEDGVFPFPEPPMPVATFTASTSPAKKKATPKPAPAVKKEEDKAVLAPATDAADKSDDASSDAPDESKTDDA